MGKYLPIAVGTTIGIFIVHSGNVVLGVVGGGLLLVGFIALVVLGNLPASLRMEVAKASDDPEVQKLEQQFETLGFLRGPNYTAYLSPPAHVSSFLSRDERSYGLVYKTGTIPSQVFFDLVSVFESDPGTEPQTLGLTSGVAPGGASLPTPRGSFVQILVGFQPANLHKQHLEGLAYLAKYRLVPQKLSLAEVPEHFRTSIARQRATFLRNLPWHTVQMLFRTMTSRSPNKRPLAQQPLALEILRNLRNAPSS